MRFAALLAIFSFLPVQAEELPANPPLAKEFLGTWDGSFDVGGHYIRFILKLANDRSGATGVLICYDQGGGEMALDAIEHHGSHLTVVLRAIAGVYEADLSKDKTNLSGIWTQVDEHFPLEMKKTD